MPGLPRMTFARVFDSRRAGGPCVLRSPPVACHAYLRPSLFDPTPSPSWELARRSSITGAGSRPSDASTRRGASPSTNVSLACITCRLLISMTSPTLHWTDTLSSRKMRSMASSMSWRIGVPSPRTTDAPGALSSSLQPACAARIWLKKPRPSLRVVRVDEHGGTHVGVVADGVPVAVDPEVRQGHAEPLELVPGRRELRLELLRGRDAEGVGPPAADGGVRPVVHGHHARVSHAFLLELGEAVGELVAQTGVRVAGVEERRGSAPHGGILAKKRNPVRVPRRLRELVVEGYHLIRRGLVRGEHAVADDVPAHGVAARRLVAKVRPSERLREMGEILRVSDGEASEEQGAVAAQVPFDGLARVLRPVEGRDGVGGDFLRARLEGDREIVGSGEIVQQPRPRLGQGE
mmetsp:Transcript_7219/g.33010  ORF Transcript_7219/g.33010 Transcript_7219/m.33010 type:complete len:406 (+) Transcript_7219:2414-3631(+)